MEIDLYMMGMMSLKLIWLPKRSFEVTDFDIDRDFGQSAVLHFGFQSRQVV